MEEIKIIALDMDGTTLTDQKTIDKPTLEAIKRAHEENILIVPATGRSLSGIPQEFIDLPIRYAILKNGAIVYDLAKNEEIFHDVIDNNLAISYLEATKNLMIYSRIGYGEQRDACYCSNLAELFRINPKYKDDSYDFVPDICDYIRKKQPKIDKITQIVFDHETSDKIVNMQKQFLDLNIMNSGYPYIEINSRMCSKGNGLKKLALSLHLNRDNVAAIGDSDNDIIMLAYAAHSFAMANGTKFIRSIASEVTTDNNNQGVKKAIDKILSFNHNCRSQH